MEHVLSVALIFLFSCSFNVGLYWLKTKSINCLLFQSFDMRPHKSLGKMNSADKVSFSELSWYGKVEIRQYCRIIRWFELLQWIFSSRIHFPLKICSDFSQGSEGNKLRRGLVENFLRTSFWKRTKSFLRVWLAH